MNELQFNRQLMADPKHLDDEMLAYLEAHPEQKKRLQSAREFDQQLSEAMQVEVPEGLEARILLKQSYLQADEEQALAPEPEASSKSVSTTAESSPSHASNEEQSRSLFWKGLMAMAASMAAVAVLIQVMNSPLSQPSIQPVDVVAHIVEHIEEDPELMTGEHIFKSDAEMQNLFASVGAKLDQPLDGMSYAGECWLDGQLGLHVVMQTEQGPVTVIVMPGQQLAAMEAFEASGYQGEMLPVKGGVVAIVGNSMEQVALAHLRFFQAVKFV